MVADITSVTTRGDILETTPESYDRLMNVNLRGPFFLTQRVAAGFVANQKDGRYRCIVNISSANAFAASINRAEYCLSKSAIRMATQLRSEEHTSELQSLMRISYAVFCLKKKKIKLQTTNNKSQNN